MDNSKNSEVEVVSVRGSKQVRPKLPKLKVLVKKYFLIILMVIAIAVISGLLIWRDQRNKNLVTNQCNGKESSPIYSEAAQYMNPSAASSKLKPIVDRMVSYNNFKTDPNCLYVVTKYYIKTMDATNAEASYAKLAKVYKPSTKLVKALGPFPQESPAALKFEVDQLQNLRSKQHQEFLQFNGIKQ